ADISTIDTFCKKIVQQYFYQLENIDPGFSVASSEESNIMLEKAYYKTLEDYEKNKDNNFEKVYSFYTKSRQDENFKNLIFSLYYFLKSKFEYKQFAKRTINEVFNTDYENNTVLNYLSDYIDEVILAYKDIFQRIQNQADQIDSKIIVSYMNDILSRISSFDNKTKNVFEKLKSIDFSKLTFSGKKKLKGEKEIQLKHNIEKSFKDLKEEIKNIKFVFDQDIDKHKYFMKQSKEQVKSIYSFIFKLDQNYSTIKKERTLLDFADLEHFAMEILKDDNIAKSIQNRYKYVFVDEYQDINNIQEQLIQRVSTQDNLFMVGDVKQSIYMFRNCDPGFFISKYKNYKNSNLGEAFNLKESFRSRKELLNFSNTIFSTLMQDKLQKINYNKQAKFIPKLEEPNSSDDDLLNPAIDINIIKTPDKTKGRFKQIDDKVYSVEKHDDFFENDEKIQTDLEQQSQIIADKINQYVDNKTIYDYKEKRFRKIQFSDIAILLRTKKNTINKVQDILTQNNIPINTKYSIDLYNTYEVRIINSFLNLINNNYDDISIVTVLSSPSFDIDYQQLADIKLNTNKDFFYKAIKDYISQNPKSKIAKVVNKLENDLKRLRLKNSSLTLTELIDYIIEKYQLDNYYLSLPNGRQRIININSLKNDILNLGFDKKFYKYIEYIKNPSDSVEISITDSPNSVKITTIHDSKGLEYPIVVLANLEKDLTSGGKQAGSDVQINKDFGMSMSVFDDQRKTKFSILPTVALKKKNYVEEMVEQIRLLYVGITRAQNNLILVGSMKQKTIDNIFTINKEYQILNYKTYL
ncbi:MAG: 3'-5' exonuclease, partial [archaeon]